MLSSLRSGTNHLLWQGPTPAGPAGCKHDTSEDTDMAFNLFGGTPCGQPGPARGL